MHIIHNTHKDINRNTELSGLFSFKNVLSNGFTLSLVGRSELCDFRHGNLIIMGHVGGRYARSDLQD